MDHGTLLVVLAVVFAFFMAWGIGANDVANAMGTSVGSSAIKLWHAVIIAAVFEALGSLLAGGQVTNTIRSQIIDPTLLQDTPALLVYGMLSSLLASGTWIIIATRFGWPVSTTHSIVGAVIGFGLFELGPKVIHWHQTVNIALSWILTPIIAGVIAYVLFRSIQRCIFNSATPIQNAKRYVPVYVFLSAFIIVAETLINGLQHIGLQISYTHSILWSLLLSACVTLLSAGFLKRFHDDESVDTKRVDFEKLEKIFGLLMVFTACAMAFAHGSNDVANAIGPLAAVVGIVHAGGEVMGQAPIPFWVLALGAFGIILGLAMYGYKVIATVGTRITELTPSRGFSAGLATASTVVIASGSGLPISTTQTLVGAILGVGFARGIAALNLSVVRNIFLSWVITLPAGAFFSVIYYYILKLIL